MFENIMTPLFETSWGKKAIFAVFILASLLSLSALIKMPIAWYNDVKLVHAEAKVVDLPVMQIQSSDLIEQIPAWHLFGNSLKDDADFLPITSLRLRLIGIVRAVPENQSRVIISEAEEGGKVYLVGDELPVGVKVNAIIEDGVILENAGHLEKLPLQRQPLSFQGMPKQLIREE